MYLKFEEFSKRYGYSYRSWIFNLVFVVTADPKHVEAILTSHKHINKPLISFVLHPWLGNGLLLAKGNKWKRMRKTITPAFHFKMLEHFVHIFNENANNLVELLKLKLNETEAFDIYPIISDTTLNIIAGKFLSLL